MPPSLCFPVYGAGDCSDFGECGAAEARGACTRSGLCACAVGYGGASCELRALCHAKVGVGNWSTASVETTVVPPSDGAPVGALLCRAPRPPPGVAVHFVGLLGPELTAAAVVATPVPADLVDRGTIAPLTPELLEEIGLQTNPVFLAVILIATLDLLSLALAVIVTRRRAAIAAKQPRASFASVDPTAHTPAAQPVLVPVGAELTRQLTARIATRPGPLIQERIVPTAAMRSQLGSRPPPPRPFDRGRSNKNLLETLRQPAPPGLERFVPVAGATVSDQGAIQERIPALSPLSSPDTRRLLIASLTTKPTQERLPMSTGFSAAVPPRVARPPPPTSRPIPRGPPPPPPRRMPAASPPPSPPMAPAVARALEQRARTPVKVAPAATAAATNGSTERSWRIRYVAREHTAFALVATLAGVRGLALSAVRAAHFFWSEVLLLLLGVTVLLPRDDAYADVGAWPGVRLPPLPTAHSALLALFLLGALAAAAATLAFAALRRAFRTAARASSPLAIPLLWVLVVGANVTSAGATVSASRSLTAAQLHADVFTALALAAATTWLGFEPLVVVIAAACQGKAARRARVDVGSDVRKVP